MQRLLHLEACLLHYCMPAAATEHAVLWPWPCPVSCLVQVKGELLMGQRRGDMPLAQVAFHEQGCVTR